LAIFYSPLGNPEVWEIKPEDYYTPEEWAALHPPPEPTLEEVRESKMAEMQASFNQHVSGSVTTTGGYKMQFDTTDSLKMQGAISLMEATGQTEGYLTQANDETVYHVPLETMKAVLVEMLAAYAQCHARKQELRALINSAETKEDLDKIIISWPV
jgi:hypothetical protein